MNLISRNPEKLIFIANQGAEIVILDNVEVSKIPVVELTAVRPFTPRFAPSYVVFSGFYYLPLMSAESAKKIPKNSTTIPP